MDKNVTLLQPRAQGVYLLSILAFEGWKISINARYFVDLRLVSSPKSAQHTSKLVLNRFPWNARLGKGNNAPFMNKTLSKAFMNRARLKIYDHKKIPAMQILKHTKNIEISVLVYSKKRKKNSIVI